MIDTHIHLNDEAFDGILESIIEEAKKNNVNRMIVIGCDYNTSVKAIEIASAYENVYAIIGLHPSEVDKEKDINLSWLRNLVKHEKVIGIGEIGIDLYCTKENKDLKVEYLKKQLDVALELNMPISVHSRDAIELTYNILSEKPYKGIIHCFSGSLEMAKKFIDKGYYLGIGGVVTFKNTKLKDVVKEIPLSCIVSETDAPYLAPTPFRGKLNKPEYIKLIVEEIANIKGVSASEVEKQIDLNVFSIFGI